MVTLQGPVLAITDLSDDGAGVLRQGLAMASAAGVHLAVGHVFPEAFRVRVLFPHTAGVAAAEHHELVAKATAAVRTQLASIVSDSKGDWRIVTIKPAGYDSPIGNRPPHIHFDVRGKTHRNVAQLYFPEDAEGNARDMLYKALGEQAGTSLAARDAGDPNKYAWDVVLMGSGSSRA